MMYCMIRIFLLAWNICVCISAKEDDIIRYSDIQNLTSGLLCNYNTDIRPIFNQSRPINLYIQLVLFGIVRLDLIYQELSTVGYLNVTWTDEHLSWNPKDHKGIKTVYLNQKKVWRPKLHLENSLKEFQGLGNDETDVLISHTGQVVWKPFQIFRSVCPIDIIKYPFDKQICDLQFAVWGYTSDIVSITAVDQQHLVLDFGFENGQWQITEKDAFVPESSVIVKFRMVLNHRSKKAFYDMIFPVLILAVVNSFTFLIPVQSGEKLGYTVTLFLSFSVYLASVGEVLPGHGDKQSQLAILLSSLVIHGACIIIISALQARLAVKTSDVPTRLQTFCAGLICKRRKIVLINPFIKLMKKYNTNAVRAINDKDRDTEESRSAEKPDETHAALTWVDVCSTIDAFLFPLFLLIVFILSWVLVFSHF